MTLEEAQKQVDLWIKKYGVRYFSELTNMAVLTEEVGELARVMARKYGDQSFKEGEKDNLEDEMADVLWVLLCLANQTGVNLTEAFTRNLADRRNNLFSFLPVHLGAPSPKFRLESIPTKWSPRSKNTSATCSRTPTCRNCTSSPIIFFSYLIL